jgi:DNA polymerase III delta subunit
MGQALDQLPAGEEIPREAILARFRNRPDEPMWHYADAVAAGDIGEALRRLGDFLVHGHPLQLMGFLENDLRRRALAAVAPNMETLGEWLGASPKSFPVQKAWRRRGAVSDSELQRALAALSRADRLLKTAPDDMHRVTMERLTVALCLWYQGKGRRAG